MNTCDYCNQEWTSEYLSMHFCEEHMIVFFFQFTGKKVRKVSDQGEIRRILEKHYGKTS